ncbi:methyl-accepting chemotaxis protein [Aliivibrio finisterrensis]|uniref:methyl-accepting chemotaxis protein n=1 Tax=Aliivibrio finisterrensis TaxID=511998 RepID=UPI00101FD169|nr:methyl-accepting chemotaxis protein [Aliivibrio finisterrensis]RYU64638.1 methyl-accepting chemotaxis protein [Aliivibrio finisterrensis]RYU67973.1 methyl-accepting chemotaxis protein [Aliivibrio finisterrensis]RYU71467.1 methyl-accepting chemotaxis protein [Aliivibrio finisterrensis]
MNKLSIKSILIIIFLIPASSLIIVMLFLTQQMNNINKQSTTIAQVWLPSVQLAERMNTLTADLRNSEAIHIISTDKSEMDKATARIDTFKTSMTDSIERYGNRNLLSAESVIFNSFKNQYTDYLKLHDELLLLSEKNENIKATEIFITQSFELYNQFSETLIELADFNNAAASKESDIGDAIYEDAVNTLYVISSVVALILLVLVALGISVIKNLDSTLFALKEGMNELANGNLTVTMPNIGKTDIGLLYISFNVITKQMNEIMTDIRDQSGNVASSATELAAVMVQSAANAEEQSAQVEQIAAAVTQLSSSSEMVSTSVRHTETQSSEAMQLCDLGRKIADESRDRANKLTIQLTATAKVVETLKQRCESIEEVATVINNISDQTNLLALNAAIEAARAGEQGRGFAVVADEVRQLAAKSQSSTIHIKTIISELQSYSVDAQDKVAECLEKIEVTKQSTDESYQQLSLIHDAVSGISSGASEVSVASEQQSRAAEEISEAINGTKEMIAQNVAGIEELSKTSSFLSEIAEKQRANMKKFKLS